MNGWRALWVPMLVSVSALVMAASGCAVDGGTTEQSMDVGHHDAHQDSGDQGDVPDDSALDTERDAPVVEDTAPSDTPIVEDTAPPGDVPAPDVPDPPDAPVEDTDTAEDTNVADISTDTGPDGAGPCPCDEPAELCCEVDGQSLCVQPTTDPDHCGACGYACDEGVSCVAGMCCDQRCPEIVTRCATGTDTCGLPLSCACPAEWACSNDQCTPPLWVVTDSSPHCEDAGGTQTACPAPGDPFYGQDGNFAGPLPSLVAYDDNIAYDTIHGLMFTRRRVDTGWLPRSIDACGALVLGGFDDWRPPSVLEVTGVLDYAVATPLPNDLLQWSNGFWVAQNPDSSVRHYMNVGGLVRVDSQPRDVVCVRGPTIEGTFEEVRSTFIDTRTGLQWMRSVVPPRPWQAGLATCNDLVADDFDDFRAANVKELATLMDLSQLDAPFTRAPLVNLSTTSDILTASPRRESVEHFSIHLVDGSIGDDPPQNSLPVLCVRGGGL